MILVILVGLYSCEKDALPIQEESNLREVHIKMDVERGFLRYNIQEEVVKKEVSRYDTTFICEKGWELRFIGFTVDGSDVNVSIYVDKSMVAWCGDTTDFETFIMIK